MRREVSVLLVLSFILVVSISFASAGFFSDIWDKVTGKVTSSSSICGNGIIDPGEQCDRDDWGFITGCSDFRFASGTLICNSNCVFDTSFCSGFGETETPEDTEIVEGGIPPPPIDDETDTGMATLSNVKFVFPTTPEGNFTQTFIEANVTFNNSLVGLDTITIFLFNSTSLVQKNTSLNSPLFVNFTNLLNDTYFLNATSNDTVGNENQTETRTIVLGPAPVAEPSESPQTPPETTEAGTNETCTDTDGGIKYNEKGTVVDGSGNSLEDSCVSGGLYNGQLQEYFCGDQYNTQYGNNLDFEYYDCPNGCNDGECISQNIIAVVVNFIVDIFDGDEISLVHPDTGEIISGDLEEIHGLVDVLHIDDFENQKSEEIYTIEELDDPTKKHILKFVGDAPYLLTESELVVKGVESDDEFLVEAVEQSESQTGSGLQIMASPSLTSTSEGVNERKIAVIMFNFRNARGEKTYSPEVIEKLMFTGEESLRNYYLDNSYGKLSLSGGVFGQYTLDRDKPDKCGWNILAFKPEFARWAGEADNLVRDSGVDLDRYDYKMYMFPKVSACKWQGTVYLRGDRSWINGKVGVKIMIHELGHNFGLGHANSFICEKQTSGSCEEKEYGDIISTMGSSFFGEGHINAGHKTSLGWISQGNIRRTGSDGVYTVNIPLESKVSSSQIHALRVGKYFIEYRQPIDFDSALPNLETRGVIITSRKSNILSFTGLLGGKTLIYDAVPNTNPLDHSLGDAALIGGNPLYDAALFDGAKFYDFSLSSTNLNSIIITQLSHDENSATVSIESVHFLQLGDRCGQEFPAVTVETGDKGNPDGAKEYIITVLNNDPPMCDDRQFFLTGALPNTIIESGDFFSAGRNFVLPAGEAYKDKILIYPSVFSHGINDFTVTVSDSNGLTNSVEASHIIDIDLSSGIVGGNLVSDDGNTIVIDDGSTISIDWTTSNNPVSCRARTSCTDFYKITFRDEESGELVTRTELQPCEVSDSSEEYYWLGEKSSSGSEIVGPFYGPKQISYLLTCPYEKGLDTGEIFVFVGPPSPSVSMVISASEGSIERDVGDTIILRWSTEEMYILPFSGITTGTFCEASGDWSGEKDIYGGFEQIGPIYEPGTYTYAINCSNSFGYDNDSITIDILPTVKLDANPKQGTGPLSVSLEADATEFIDNNKALLSNQDVDYRDVIWEFDFEGDGTYDTYDEKGDDEEQKIITKEHTYSQGIHNPRARITFVALIYDDVCEDDCDLQEVPGSREHDACVDSCFVTHYDTAIASTSIDLTGITGPLTVSVEGALPTWSQSAIATVTCDSTVGVCQEIGYNISETSITTCTNNINEYTVQTASSGNPSTTINSHVWVCGYAKDSTGNELFSAPVEFLVDNIPPSVSVISPISEPQASNFDEENPPDGGGIEGTTAIVTCIDEESSCARDSYKYKIYTYPVNSCSTVISEYSIGLLVQVVSDSWICGYAEDLAGNGAFSDPFEFKADSSLNCADTDGGIDYSSKGNCVDPLASIEDRCFGSSIRESYCGLDNACRTESYTCPNGCSEGACLPLSVDVCSLSSASWSITQATERDIVRLNVVGTSGCDGQTVSFEVLEEELVGSNPVRINPVDVTFIGTTAIGTWTAEWIDDGLFQGDPEYYFIASVTGDSINSGTSGTEELHVSQSIEEEIPDRPTLPDRPFKDGEEIN